jgi:hypothetical protein
VVAVAARVPLAFYPHGHGQQRGRLMLKAAGRLTASGVASLGAGLVEIATMV